MNFYHLKKRGGSRMHNIHTFSNICDNKKKSDIIFPKKILQDTIHEDQQSLILLGKITNSDKVIAKIQKADHPFSKIESKIIKKLSKMKNNNFVKFICEFKCEQNKIKYNKKIQKLCEIGDDNIDLHIILQEYINGGEMDKFIKKFVSKLDKNLQKKIIISIIQQYVYASIQAFKKFGFLHRDINAGNILISYDKNKKNIYKKKYIIGINTYYVDIIYNIEPVLVDYGRSKLDKKRTKEEFLIWEIQDFLVILSGGNLFKNEILNFNTQILNLETINVFLKILEKFIL